MPPLFVAMKTDVATRHAQMAVFGWFHGVQKTTVICQIAYLCDAEARTAVDFDPSSVRQRQEDNQQRPLAAESHRMIFCTKSG